MTSRLGPATAFGVLLVVATAARVAAVGVPGHSGDVGVMARWAERMAEVGPLAFYGGSGSIYPAVLYPLWGLGALLDGDALATAIKGLSIPFDIGIGATLWALLRSRLGERAALAASGLYLLNPAVLLAGPVWGQLDAAGTLAFLGALVASAARRDGIATALGVLAGLIKPQFGLAALVVVVVAIARSRAAHDWRPLAWSLAGGASAYAVVAAPLALDSIRYVELLRSTAAYKPYTSLHAFNPWGLLVGFRVPDEPYVGIGAALLVLGLLVALVPLRRGSDLASLLATAALMAIAFYMLPTRVHERYLFPAMALLVPFAILGRRPLAAYAVLTAAFAASLAYALHRTTAFTVPAPLGEVLTSPAGTWAIGVALIAASAWWAWALIRRPLPVPRGDP